MADLLSSVFGSASGSNNNSVVLRQSMLHPGMIHIQPVGASKDAPPLYDAVTHSLSKPNVCLYRGPSQSNQLLGDARFHSLSSKIDLTLMGQAFSMKQSQLSGSLTVDHPQLGRFKWSLNQLTMSSLELSDSSGRSLAKLKSSGIPGLGGKKIEMFVSVDDYMMDLIVLSGVVAMVQTKALKEVINAVAGA